MAIAKKLITKGLAKSYKKRQVVHDFSMEMRAGEIIGLMGPNGAGKTTCFYMILGLVAPDQGSIFIDDVEITRVPVHARAALGIGYLPQEPSIFRKLSCEDNIMAILELNQALSDKERLNRLEELLSEFGLTRIRQSLGVSLSGGERRRVELARALASNPSFLLLDEPFAGVDPISIIDIKNTLKALSAKGIGIIITEHNVREALEICDSAYVVHEGRVLAHGDKKALLANDEVRTVYLGKDFQ